MPLSSRTTRTRPTGPEDSAGAVPEQPGLPPLAERLIRDRFEAFSVHYRPAVKRPFDDVEAVHQLRVSSRRLTAALQTLQPLLPEKPRNKLIRDLKAVRRAAGDARDLDVFRERVKSSEFTLKCKSRSRVLKFLKKRRRRAQQPLRKAFKSRSPGKLRRRVEELLTAIPRQADEFLLHDAACGSDLVGAAVARFSSEVPATFETAADLHQLRICGKRLRYALETLLDLRAIAAPETAERLVEVLKQIQDRLGNINDRAVSQRRLKSWADDASRPSLRTAFQQMAAVEATQSAERTAEFFGWWSDERQQSFRGELNALARE